MRRGQNGLLLTRCRGCAAYDDDFSFLSGWGVALWRSSRCEVSHDRLDFCVRGYSDGVYARGQDSAAILVFEQSSNNLFARNSATHSGDGFFLYAGHETTQRTGRGGSNDNVVVGNDFRFAVANGIEATFSSGNVFDGNDGSGSDYGIWAGYSRDSRFTRNVLRDCRTAGVAIEHGNGNMIAENDMAGARYGVRLWWDDDPDLVGGVYGQHQDTSSGRNVLLANQIAATDAAVSLESDVGTRLLGNRFPGPATQIRLAGTTTLSDVLWGEVSGDLVVENRTGHAVRLASPDLAPGRVRTEGDPVSFVALASPGSAPPVPPPPTPSVRGTLDTQLPADLPAGRASMRIDAWGPVDPRETRLFPTHVSAPGPEARLHLLGAKSFRVVETSPGVSVEPREGTAPATIVVRASGDGPSLRPFRVVVASASARYTSEGTLLVLPWDVRFFTWDDATDPLAHPDAFAALLRSDAPREVHLDALDFPWRAGGPEGVATDRFATRAEATATLPAGRYRLRVVSDDGVRAYVDEKKVIERWDRHGPTEDTADLDLAAGAHAIRIEHFEIDGWSWLSARLEPR